MNTKKIKTAAATQFMTQARSLCDQIQALLAAACHDSSGTEDISPHQRAIYEVIRKTAGELETLIDNDENSDCDASLWATHVETVANLVLHAKKGSHCVHSIEAICLTLLNKQRVTIGLPERFVGDKNEVEAAA